MDTPWQSLSALAAKGFGIIENAELVDFLTKFEEGRNFQFALKPMQLSPLSLVGWLQNDQTKEIVQAAIVPVEGELVFSDK